MQGVLIAGNRSAVFNALANESEKRGNKIFQALIPDSGGASPNLNNAELLDWNPASPVSARSLVVAADSRLQPFNTAIIVVAPPSKNDGNELKPVSVENLINNFIKGPIFLAREIQNHFVRLQQGTLLLVLPYPEGGSIIGAAIVEAWRAFITEFLQYTPMPVRTMGFTVEKDLQDHAADFAAFVCKTMDSTQKKDAGKLFRYKKFF